MSSKITLVKQIPFKQSISELLPSNSNIDFLKHSVNPPLIERDLFSAEVTLKDKLYFDEKFIEITDNSTNFSIKTFIEFMLYHILFFMLLGPLTSIIILCFYKNLTLARNLGFWGINLNFFTQTGIFLFNFIGLFGFLYLNVSIISPIEILMLLGGCLIRSLVIAIKYSLFPQKKIDYVKYKRLEKKELINELLINWILQKDEDIENELQATIQRNNIDEDIFYFFFLKPLKEGLIKELTKKTVLEGNFRNKGFNLEKVLGKKAFYSGYSIARYLLKENRKPFLMPILMLSCFLISFIHALIPLFFRIGSIGYSNNALGDSGLEIFLGICIISANIYYYMMNFMFILIGVFECDRITKVLSQLSNFLAVRNVEIYHIQKIFPTINIFCLVSFRSWFTLNIIARDYGNRFLKRIDMHLGVFLVYYLMVLIGCLVSIYEVIPRFPMVYYVVLGFEMFLVFMIIFFIIFKGAIINRYSSLHEGLFNENKQNILDFMAFDKIYFENPSYITQNDVYSIGIEVIKENIAIYYDLNDKRPSREKRKTYLSRLILMNENITSQLNFQQSNYPFKILRVPATMATLQSLLGIVGSSLMVIFNKLTD